jgi:hypothetical protein
MKGSWHSGTWANFFLALCDVKVADHEGYKGEKDGDSDRLRHHQDEQHEQLKKSFEAWL